DVDISRELSRGQYLDGGKYLSSGVWFALRASAANAVELRIGSRGALTHAQADGDPESSSATIERTWWTAVGNAGLTWHAVDWLAFVANIDQGFRAPNLDDLTSRQQTGPGFQFENPQLDP